MHYFRALARTAGRRLALAALIAFVAPAWAEEAPAVPAAVKEALQRLLPEATPQSVAPSPIAGLYEVVVGARVFYMSADGRHLLDGDLIDLEQRHNLSEMRRNALRAELVAGLSEEEMIIFAPPEPKHTITVFTDVDCGYCRKLHSEIEAYNRQGVAVRYLAYPRAGVGSESYRKSVSVWCAKDRHKALTDAKKGLAVPTATCDDPVQKHMALGEIVGVSGTPTLVLEDGRVVPGYVPADRLSSLFPPQQAKKE